MAKTATVIDGARRRLDSVMAPVRRGDAPEAAFIEAEYGAASRALSNLAYTYGSTAPEIRQYVAGLLETERILAALMPQWRAGLITQPTLNQEKLGLDPWRGMADFTNEKLKEEHAFHSQYRVTGQYTLTAADGGVVTVTYGKDLHMPTGVRGAVLDSTGRMLVVVGLAMDTQTLLAGESTYIERGQATVGLISGGSTVIAGGASALTGGGVVTPGLVWASTAFGTVASTTGVAGAGFAIGWGIGTVYANRFERDEVNGVNTLDRIWSSPPKTAVDTAGATVETGLYGVHAGANKLGELAYGTPKYVPADYRPSWQNTELLAEIRKAHPNAHLQVVDGSLNVVIPAPPGAEYATFINIDNHSGRVT